jgi:hypothetical protein
LKWINQDDTNTADTGSFTIEYTDEYAPTVLAMEYESVTPHTPSLAHVPATPEPAEPATPVQFVSPTPDHEVDLDDDHDDYT